MKAYTIETNSAGKFTFFIDKIVYIEQAIDKEDASKKYANALEQWNNDVKMHIQKISDSLMALELEDPITMVKFMWAPTEENMMADNALDMYQLYSDKVTKIAKEKAGTKPVESDFFKYKYTLKFVNNECRYISEKDYNNIMKIIHDEYENKRFTTE